LTEKFILKKLDRAKAGKIGAGLTSPGSKNREKSRPRVKRNSAETNLGKSG